MFEKKYGIVIWKKGADNAYRGTVLGRAKPMSKTEARRRVRRGNKMCRQIGAMYDYKVYTVCEFGD